MAAALPATDSAVVGVKGITTTEQQSDSEEEISVPKPLDAIHPTKPSEPTHPNVEVEVSSSRRAALTIMLVQVDYYYYIYIYIYCGQRIEEEKSTIDKDQSWHQFSHISSL